MTPYHQDDLVTLWHGDCRQVMADLPECSVDAVVTDPPYELAFMGKGWDASGIAYNQDVWDQAHRILKPGGHLLAFGGTRTWHRLAVAIEDAGFEVRDSIAWMYGSGFPKSLDVSKAIDKAAGAEREVVGHKNPNKLALKPGASSFVGEWKDRPTVVEAITAPATPAAEQWQGWGTALKPAFEPIVVARKPLIGTVAENVLALGTGALNIDGCRIGWATETERAEVNQRSGPNSRFSETVEKSVALGDKRPHAVEDKTHAAGRWPANVILDESQAAELDKQSGVFGGQVGMRQTVGKVTFTVGEEINAKKFDHGTADFGGASRFFYCPKANSSERPRAGDTAHPTVKPLELMRYLVKLVTPPGGTVLEPFAGSGTTLEACVVEGFQVIGIELTEDYLPLITQRVSKPIEQVLL